MVSIVYTGKYGEIDKEGIHWNDVTLDFSCITSGEDQNPNRVVRSFVTDTMLYVFVSEVDLISWEEAYALYGIRLADGRSNRIPLANPINVCMMDDDTFIVLEKDSDRYSFITYRIHNNISKAFAIDTSKLLSSWTVGGLAYDPISKAVYVCTNDRVMRGIEGNNLSVCGFISCDSMLEESAAFINNGTYFLYTVDHLYA